EGALEDVADARLERAHVDRLVCLLRVLELDVARGRLDLHDVGAELAGDLRGVGDDVDRGLALLGEIAARVGPDDGRQADLARLADEVAEVLVHRVPELRARIDGVADGRAAEAERVLDGRGERGAGR